MDGNRYFYRFRKMLTFVTNKTLIEIRPNLKPLYKCKSKHEKLGAKNDFIIWRAKNKININTKK